MTRKPHPSDVSDEEWSFVAPYLTLMRVDAPQRQHDLREIFNVLRFLVRAGSPWRYLSNDLPPWEAVYQQTQRWIAAGVFEAMVHDLRELLRVTAGRYTQPSAATVARCNRRRRAGIAPATTEPNARRVPRCMRWWTRWGICWRCV